MPKAKRKLVRKAKAHQRRRFLNTQAIVKVPVAPERPWMLTQDEVTIVKNSIAKGATDDELKFCLTVARRYKLDPFKQQIWFVQRWDSNADNGRGGRGAKVWTAQVGINGILFCAARDHKEEFGSISLPEYGPMFTVEGQGKMQAPEWAIVKVWKKGAAEPTEAQAYWDEYAPADLSKAPFWRKMPRRMIGKCATALAIREAYPDLGGLYIPEECERMAEDYTRGGRQITEVAAVGTRAAAEAVARQKLQAHDAGKPISSQADEYVQETISAIPWKEGRLALAGTGLNVLKSEVGSEAFKEIGIVFNVADRVTHMPLVNWFILQDRAAKCGIAATLLEAGQR